MAFHKSKQKMDNLLNKSFRKEEDNFEIDSHNKYLPELNKNKCFFKQNLKNGMYTYFPKWKK